MMVKLFFYFFTSIIWFPIVGCMSGSQEQPSITPSISITQINLLSYDTQTAHITLKGNLTGLTITPLTSLFFHSNSTCSDLEIGKGIAEDLSHQGIEISVSSIAPTPLYVLLNSDPTCYYVTDYTPQINNPAPPTYTSMIPSSPSKTNYTPFIYGTTTGVISEIIFYDDPLCIHQIGLGNSSDFKNFGIPLTLTPNQTSQIYAQSKEPLGKISTCELLTSYTHDSSVPSAPSFLSMTPSSPSNSSTTPTIRGSVTNDITNVNLFADSGCSVQLATDTAANFTTTGITVTVPLDYSTTIYAQGVDTQSTLSVCGYLTTFVSDKTPPTSPTFLNASPQSPTLYTTYPVLTGTTSIDSTSIKFYNNSNCTTQIGTGTASKFQTTGINVSVSPNSTTTIYAKSLDAAENSSTCTLLTEYTHDTLAPDPPGFDSTSPASPNNITTSPFIIGTVSIDSLSVKLFDDSTCNHKIGEGSTNDFITLGIQVNVIPNVVVPIYGKSFDDVGNPSECTALTNYSYSNIIPQPPTFTLTLPPSPSNLSSSPLIFGTVTSTIATVELYSNSNCSSLLNSGTASAFQASGITVTLSQNLTSEVYAKAIDIYSNISNCVLLTSYTHDNISPTQPTYSNIIPSSPNNITTTPMILGIATADTQTVRFYDSADCTSLIGEGAGGNFATGILISVASNLTTEIYAKSFDPAHNSSPCTFQTYYTYDDLQPGVPTFISATPMTPSYVQQTTISGSIAGSPDFLPVTIINLYSNTNCTSAVLGTGSPSTFLNPGISIAVPQNTTTLLYGQSVNQVGTLSDCNALINYVHNDLGPSGLYASSSSNGAVNLSWYSDANAATYIVKRSLWSGGPYTLISPLNFSTSFQDQNINNNVTYYYVVAAQNSTGVSKDSLEVAVTINALSPIPPTGLSALPGNNQVQVSWNKHPTHMTFSIYRATQSGGPYTRLAQHLSASTYSDLTALNNVSYYYVVTAQNPSGTSLFSSEISTQPKQVPLAPTSIQGQYIPGSGFEITWSAPSYYNKFNIKRGPISGLTSTIITVDITNGIFRYIDTNPQQQNPFDPLYPNYYAVSAVWGNSESLNSSEVGFAFTNGPTVTARAGDTEIILNWTYDTFAQSYKVMRSESPGGPYTILNAAVVTNDYSDQSLTNDKTYYYVVVSNYAGGISSLNSFEVNATTRASENLGPTNLIVFNKSDNTPLLHFSPPSQQTGYNIYRSNSGGPFIKINSSPVTSIPYNDLSVPMGINSYYVKALWGGNETPASNSASYRHGYPTSLSATSGASTITLTWSSVTNATSYNIHRADNKSGPYTLISSSATGTSFIDSGVTGLTLNQGYFYIISANFSDLTVGQRSIIIASAMAGSSTIPSGVTITQMTAASAILTWAPVPGATSYKVYKQINTGGGPYQTPAAATPTTNSANLLGLTSGKLYFFVITSIVSGVESALSSEVSAFTAATPTAPIGTVGNGVINLTWGSSGPATYSLQRTSDGTNFTTVTPPGYTSTNFLDSTVTNGTIYFYKVQVTYSGVSTNFYSLLSSPLTPGTVPPIPLGLTVTNNSNGTDVTLSWGLVNGSPVTYNVKYSTANGGPYSLYQNVGGLSVTVSGLSSGIIYYFVVSAQLGSYESSNSPQIAVVLPNASPPPAPTVSVVNNSSVSISWAPVTSGALNALSYDVLRSTDYINYETIYYGATSTNYTDNSAINGQTYYYKYKPYYANSASSEASLPSTYVQVGVPPLIPQSLVVHATSSSSVTLSWVPAPNSTSYNIYQSSNSGVFSPPSVLNTSQLTATLTGLAPGTYYFVVTALDVCGMQSSYSNEATITLTLPPPSNLIATAGNNQVQLSWDSVVGSSNYTLKRGVSSSGPFGSLVTQSGLTYIDTQVTPNTTYYYKIISHSAGGNPSEDSSVASATVFSSVNLVVPVELTDRSLSSTVVPMTFARTKTTLDTSAYDGTLSFELELIAINADNSDLNVSIVNSTGNTVAQKLIPQSTYYPTRFSTTLTPQNVQDHYRIKLDASSANDQLQVLSAKILIHQLGASRTRIYIPLLSSDANPTYFDSTASIASTTLSTFSELNKATIYQRNTQVFSELENFNAWQLETLVSTSGGATGTVALYNTTTGQLVSDTQSLFNSNNQIMMTSAPFNEGISNFNPLTELHNYQVGITCSLNCSLGTISIFKAALWVNVYNLTKTEIYYRNGLARTLGGSTYLDEARIKIDLSLFSNPLLFFQSVLTPASGGSATVWLSQDSTDFDFANILGNISGSNLNFTTPTKQLLRSPSSLALISSGELPRLLPKVIPISGFSQFNSSVVVIQVSP